MPEIPGFVKWAAGWRLLHYILKEVKEMRAKVIRGPRMPYERLRVICCFAGGG